MANTYTQLYIHAIFAVKGRNNLISKTWIDKLYKYITGIVTNTRIVIFTNAKIFIFDW